MSQWRWSTELESKSRSVAEVAQLLYRKTHDEAELMPSPVARHWLKNISLADKHTSTGQKPAENADIYVCIDVHFEDTLVYSIYTSYPEYFRDWDNDGHAGGLHPDEFGAKMPINSYHLLITF